MIANPTRGQLYSGVPGMHQRGSTSNVVNLARGQLNRENVYFPVAVRGKDFGL